MIIDDESEETVYSDWKELLNIIYKDDLFT